MVDYHPVVEEIANDNRPLGETMEEHISKLPEYGGNANHFLQTTAIGDHPEGQRVGIAQVFEGEGVALAIQTTNGRTDVNLINSKQELAAHMQNIHERDMSDSGMACQLSAEQAVQIMDTLERLPEEQLTKGENVDFAVSALKQKIQEEAKTQEATVEQDLNR